ncbi:MAG: hypothetical protein M1118_14725 [Chloroflexi bacterium]|nr:hypothetical protein [Chloroflexota bacterium]
MATVDVTASTLTVHVSGLDRVLAFRGRLEVPLSHVVGAEYNPKETQQELEAFWKETFIPGAVSHSDVLVGTFTEHGDRIFWDVHHPDRAVIINLSHEKYAKIIVEVDNPQETASRIQAVLSEKHGV